MCKEVDCEEPFERGAVAQIVLERDAGIVDENIDRVDFLDSRPNLRGVCDVQLEERDAAVGVGKWLRAPA